MLKHAKRAGRAFVVSVIAITAPAAFSTAEAVSAGVRNACANDYFAYCSAHDPDGSGVRQCMRANGRRLSQTCINALAAAGEIPTKLAKRAQSRR